MLIKKLDITGFGKFDNETIVLENGINIIYGENESGKTTIHNFIDGMFYGFLKPNVKSTRYLDEHRLYEPWDKNQYSGIISFIFKDEQYRIEREFTKGKERTIIFLENTGEDVTANINTGSRGRILQPGFHFFGFNSSVYRNTVSIKQLNTKTQDDLAREVKEKLINATESLDERISVKQAVSSLEEDLKEIGSERAPTSTYGKTKAQIDKLKKDIYHINLKRSQYEELLKESERLENEYLNINAELNQKKELLNDIEIMELQEIYHRGTELNEEIVQLEEKVENVEKCKDLSEEDYDNLSMKRNELKVLEQGLKFNESSKRDIENKIIDLRKSIDAGDDDQYDEISEDYLSLETMEEERNTLSNKEWGEITNNNDGEYRKNRKFLLIGIVASIFLFIISSFIGDLHVVISLMAFLIFVIFVMAFIKSSNNLNRAKKIQDEEITKKIKRIDVEKERILNKYDLKYLAQLKNLYEEIKYNKFKKDEVSEVIGKSQSELARINKEIGKLKDNIEDNEIFIDEILKRNKVDNEDDFKKYLDFKREYTIVTSQLENKKILYNRIMGKYTLEILKKKLEEYTPKHLVDIDEKETILKDKKLLEAKVADVQSDMTRNEVKLSNMEEELNSMVLLEEELNDKETLIEEMDRNIDAIALAKSTIEELSKSIHDDFAPHINRKVSDIIDKITNGKYRDIKVDDNLELGILNPVSNEILKDRALSGGTMDQLYFSLRFGIITSISEDNLPLILDDCFIQYDDYRLRNVLELLCDIGKERQIILFSCHNREKELLDELNIRYNLISLA